MDNQKRNLFRQGSLERLSPPERLDQLMQVVGPKDWIPLATTGSLVVLALVWSLVGRIPTAVVGRGVLIQPRRVVEFQSPIAGQLKELNVQVGQCIKKNHLLATIDRADLEQQPQQQRAQLKELETQDRELSSLQAQKAQSEKQFIKQQRQALQQRLRNAQALVSNRKDQETRAIQQQRQALQQRLRNAQAVAPTLQKRLENRRQLKVSGAISQDVVLEAEQAYRDTLNQMADLRAQLQELGIRELQAEQSNREASSQVADLRAQLQELDSKEESVEQQTIESTNARKNQIQEVKRTIAQQELQLQKNSQILSQQAGCILELTTTVGQSVGPGTRLGTIQVGNSPSGIVAVTYLPVRDGKKIKPGMDVQITPDTVKRAQFGGILGKVTSVSAFPVTKQGAASLIGNTEVAESLIPQGGAVAVFAELQQNPSTFSGYQWSASKGPQLKITPGTTIATRITVEQRPPITFVLPLLRSASGTY